MAQRVGQHLSNGYEPTQHSPVVDGYVSRVRPAPASMSDPVWVIVPASSLDKSYRCAWSPIHGQTLPAQGAAVKVAMSAEGVPTVVWWDGSLSEGWEPGDFKWSGRATCGSQWVGPAEGQEVDAASYPGLAAAFGTGAASRFGAADEGKVRLPDGRNRTLIGASSTRALGSNGGEEAVALTVAEMPAHAHGGSTATGTTGTESATHSHKESFYDTTGAGTLGAVYTNIPAMANIGTEGNDKTHTHQVPKLSISSEGGSGAHNNMPPYIAANLFVHV